MNKSGTEKRNVESEIRLLQVSIDRLNLRRASQLSMAEKFRLGADLYDDGIRWLRHIIQAEHPDFSGAQVESELNRRREVLRKLEQAGLTRTADEEPAGAEVEL